MDAFSRPLALGNICSKSQRPSSGGGRKTKAGVPHLVLDEVRGVVGVAVLEQEVLVDRSLHDPRLQPAEPLQRRIARGDGPHGDGVEEVHVLGGRLLRHIAAVIREPGVEEKQRSVDRFDKCFFAE